ncbi:hypothetical protein MC7420_534 [Coleofasciculus chthonoplastes PCC 7420]|uniref:Uncharacterized protein n=1 Tax=Coleofasciculus chthonoplastes PCC 7420 TaxID=118168 RepID=B4VLI7_9CYAN|nr:hypothetical protein MC7420_534 [Coleofasciculus chthonoplastes PCC 7420]
MEILFPSFPSFPSFPISPSTPTPTKSSNLSIDPTML